jgi:hypothetical protein
MDSRRWVVGEKIRNVEGSWIIKGSKRASWWISGGRGNTASLYFKIIFCCEEIRGIISLKGVPIERMFSCNVMPDRGDRTICLCIIFLKKYEPLDLLQYTSDNIANNYFQSHIEFFNRLYGRSTGKGVHLSSKLKVKSTESLRNLYSQMDKYSVKLLTEFTGGPSLRFP